MWMGMWNGTLVKKSREQFGLLPGPLRGPVRVRVIPGGIPGIPNVKGERDKHCRNDYWEEK